MGAGLLASCRSPFGADVSAKALKGFPLGSNEKLKLLAQHRLRSLTISRELERLGARDRDGG